MASLSTGSNGKKRIMFYDKAGTRRTIYLGAISRKDGDSILTKIEAINNARIGGYEVDRDTAHWLGHVVSDVLYNRLMAVGLVGPRKKQACTTLEGWLDQYIASLTNKKPNTIKNYKQVRRYLLSYFDASTVLGKITRADADKWHEYMIKHRLADSTIARVVKAVRTIFKKAMRWELIEHNPFEGIKAGGQSNKDRLAFITREVIDCVIEACPDAQWRLLVALSRYGGLRCPSEHLSLKWSDILWDQDRIRVPSPKTEHLPGGECRIIPLFPELRQPLMEVFDEAEEGAQYVITRYQQANCNLRTQFLRIIHKAGVTPWPRLFHNLRASRETELANDYPIQTVCQWIGNSADVARNHYLQVTDEHFARAAGKAAPSATRNTTRHTAKLGGSKGKLEIGSTLVSAIIANTYHNITLPNNSLSGATGNRTPIC
ncbi:MAG: phage integrase SAM-like domain-containing protein [Phycisphaerales bacterium]|nr:phage integrase SAM-like domain-containing protein [Phycisphaerales bacterium]